MTAEVFQRLVDQEKAQPSMGLIFGCVTLLEDLNFAPFRDPGA
jgi:hypothetical protein